MSHEQNSVNFIQNKCDSVLRCISDSSLNYVIQSTPYSIYITIRKSLSKCNPNLDNKSLQSAQNDSFQSGKSDHQLQALQKRNTFLEDANETLRGDLENSVMENETSIQKIDLLERQNVTLAAKLNKENSENEIVVKQFQQFKDALKVLEFKHADIRTEKADLEEERKNLKVALKISQRETKETSYKLEKKVVALEEKLKALEEITALHAAEGKELKNKTKKVNKKLKSIEEREAKFKVDKLTFQKVQANSEQEIVEDTFDDELRDENKNDLIQVQQLMSTLSPHSCLHNPQCILRLPFPSPDGPLTLDQFNLSQPSNSREVNTLDYNSTEEDNNEDNSKDNSLRGMVESFQSMIKLVTEMSGTVQKMEKKLD